MVADMELMLSNTRMSEHSTRYGSYPAADAEPYETIDLRR